MQRRQQYYANGLARNIYVKNARSRDNANFIKYRKAHLDLLDDLSNALCALRKLLIVHTPHFGSMKIAFTNSFILYGVEFIDIVLCYTQHISYR